MTRTPRSVLVNLWHKSFLWKSDNLYAEPNRQAWEKMFTCCLSFLTKYMLLVFQQQAALLCQFIVKWKHLSIVCRSAVDAKINSKRKWPPLLLICDRFFLTLQWTPTLAKCVKTYYIYVRFLQNWFCGGLLSSTALRGLRCNGSLRREEKGGGRKGERRAEGDFFETLGRNALI